jgi:hypothetical protein
MENVFPAREIMKSKCLIICEISHLTKSGEAAHPYKLLP